MSVRVRFAPSPTGGLHIGGVRTALYNYLFAKKMGGTFILRIEDTDQNRFVPGAEAYIQESLKWLGIEPTEGQGYGDGPYAPYRQSERKAIYQACIQLLLDNGSAYYAYDSEETLTAMRKQYEQEGKTFKYDYANRTGLNNDLNKSSVAPDAATRVIRLKVEPGQLVRFEDVVRGAVEFNSNELDDKVLMKADGMPTYHFANVVDDFMMKITHVIRGEEWLPSTPVHILLYRAFGWEAQMPKFAHLPLLLKPVGNGKLSKRDGEMLGFPVFPLQWNESLGFRELGYLPQATLNFLALLGWHDESDREVFETLDDLAAAFDLNRISKSGARFDIEKAKHFNQLYIHKLEPDALNAYLSAMPELAALTTAQLTAYAAMYKERVVFLKDFATAGSYLLGEIASFDQDAIEKKVLKKWSAERKGLFEKLAASLATLTPFDAAEIKTAVEAFAQENSLGFGEVLPVLRLALSGTMQGPTVFDMMAFLGVTESQNRLLGFCTRLG